MFDVETIHRARRYFLVSLTAIALGAVPAGVAAAGGDKGKLAQREVAQQEQTPDAGGEEPTDRPGGVDRWRAESYPGPLSEETLSQLRADLQEMLDGSSLPATSAGIFVVDMQSGQVLFDHRSDHKMIPASNAKLVTSAAALDIFGPAHTFETELFARPAAATDGETSSERPLSAAADGVFSGDLIVRGGGEPFLLFEDLVGWAAELRLRGVRKIDGDLVVDDSEFAGEYLPPGFGVKDEDEAFRSPIGPFSVNFNSITVKVRPADEVGEPPTVRVQPPNDYVKIVNESRTYRGDSGYIEVTSEPIRSSKPEDSMAGGPRTRITIDGSLGRQAGAWVSRVRIDHPPGFSASVLREALALVGIEVTGTIRLGEVPSGLSPVMTHSSRPLAAIVSAMNKWSNNFMAEQLLRAIGATRDGPATWAQSRSVVEAFMSKVGVSPGRYRLQNGSGLYRGSQIPPDAIVQLLVHMWNHPASSEYISSLAVAGRDGTLRDRMEDSAAADNLRAKTGTLAHASALSGYVETRSGRPLAFACLFDNTPRKGWRYRELQNELMIRLAEVDR